MGNVRWRARGDLEAAGSPSAPRRAPPQGLAAVPQAAPEAGSVLDGLTRRAEADPRADATAGRSVPKVRHGATPTTRALLTVATDHALASIEQTFGRNRAFFRNERQFDPGADVRILNRTEWAAKHGGIKGAVAVIDVDRDTGRQTIHVRGEVPMSHELRTNVMVHELLHIGVDPAFDRLAEGYAGASIDDAGQVDLREIMIEGSAEYLTRSLEDRTIALAGNRYDGHTAIMANAAHQLGHAAFIQAYFSGTASTLNRIDDFAAEQRYLSGDAAGPWWTAERGLNARLREAGPFDGMRPSAVDKNTS
jgi:hypothetical protein